MSDKFRKPGNPEVTRERPILQSQGLRLLATPMQNALAEHSHRVDHLGVAAQ